MTFDMQAAQICAVTLGADTRMALKAALDEIERLRAENAGWRKEHEAMHDDAIMQATRIAEQVGDIKKLKEDLSEVWQVHDEQAKRIAELEGTQCYSGACSYAVNYEEDMTTCRIRIDKQRAALKKLGRAKRERGKALVEERKLRMQLDASRFGMGIPEEIAIARSREQLRQEGNL